MHLAYQVRCLAGIRGRCSQRHARDCSTNGYGDDALGVNHLDGRAKLAANALD
jgi:hypothetical protein